MSPMVTHRNPPPQLLQSPDTAEGALLQEGASRNPRTLSVDTSAFGTVSHHGRYQHVLKNDQQPSQSTITMSEKLAGIGPSSPRMTSNQHQPPMTITNHHTSPSFGSPGKVKAAIVQAKEQCSCNFSKSWWVISKPKSCLTGHSLHYNLQLWFHKS